jgi:predicted  nucleic acid-binding Zn-ribbon protein
VRLTEKDNAMNLQNEIADTKWELAELSGSLHQLSRQINAMRQALELSLARDQQAAGQSEASEPNREISPPAAKPLRRAIRLNVSKEPPVPNVWQVGKSTI